MIFHNIVFGRLKYSITKIRYPSLESVHNEEESSRDFSDPFRIIPMV